jgi:ribose transport system permease protein
MNDDWKFHLREHKGAYAAAAMFVVIFALYILNHQAGWTAPVITTAANKGVLLAIVAMAQTLPVLTAGIDLSVGMVFVLANCVASHLVVGTPLQAAFGVVAVLAVGALCGWINGAIIVYGRLQPIITTLATGTVYYGIALGLRPVPGGDVHAGLADALTGSPGGVPAMLLVLLGVVLLVWVPYRRSVSGRAALAIGSSEAAAYMSGVNIGRTKLIAYTLAGLLAAIGGLLLTFVTYSGEASSTIGGVYTLNSIAAVVIGGN